ncbi:MAG: hypothetical protein HC822_23160 [Oscillochloris sp.]|nr:hypothetical protein [Oscillochloris sp.]
MIKHDEVYVDGRKLAIPALLVGVLGLIGCGIGFFVNPETFFEAYLVAFLFWLGIALGGLGITMLHYIVGGLWGLFIRRGLESAALTLPLLLLLALPLLLGLGHLYEWTRPEVIAADETLQLKTPYLNLPFFFIRAAIYFAAWITLSLLINRWSQQQDRSGDARLAGRLRSLSYAGLILYIFTTTFAAYDWIMSIQPHWASSVFGLLLIAGQALAGLSFGILTAALLARRNTLLQHAVTPGRFGDLGSLLLVLVMFWMYINLSQFLIIWSGNLPEEVIWYVERSQNGWQWLIWALFTLQFVVPLAVLISRDARRSMLIVAGLAGMLLAAHLVELFWRVIPAFRSTLALHWLDLAAAFGVGGVWLAAFAWLFGRRPVVPLHDPLTPRLQEVSEHG